MVLPDALIGGLLVAAIAAVVVLAAVIVRLVVHVAELRRHATALDPERQADIITVLERQSGELDQLRRALELLHANAKGVEERLGQVISRVGVIRYDAFGDVGGGTSFSAALLDEHGSGVVISAINGRAETRCYAKPVLHGAAELDLSTEEKQAIDRALPARGTPARRRERKRATR